MLRLDLEQLQAAEPYRMPIEVAIEVAGEAGRRTDRIDCASAGRASPSRSTASRAPSTLDPRDFVLMDAEVARRTARGRREEMPRRFIEVEKARQNNLKGVSVRVPIGAVTAVTGVAGAGKSSLAFDVLYAEGHRRYAETFSPYARQFLERLDRPRAERIEGVLPAVAVDRTAPVRTSRSTVGTMTSVADYLRALYARAATLHCRQCGQPVRRDTPSSIFDALVEAAEGRTALVSLPAPRREEGGHRRRARGLREGGIPSGAGGWRGEYGSRTRVSTPRTA